MKYTPRYFFLLLLLSLVYNQAVSGMSVYQNPEIYRVFDSDFKERYAGEKYNYEGKKVIRHTPEGSGTYEDYKKSKTKTKEDNNTDSLSINLELFKGVFYLILIGALGALVYILLKEGTTGGLFRSEKQTALQDYSTITAENIADADIHALIKTAEAHNDYRLAVRYYYLLVLKTLSLKKHIKFEDDKTNADYLNELHGHPLGQAFSYTSYLYNYIWYGKFAVDQHQYTKAKQNFTSLLKQVNS